MLRYGRCRQLCRRSFADRAENSDSHNVDWVKPAAAVAAAAVGIAALSLVKSGSSLLYTAWVGTRPREKRTSGASVTRCVAAGWVGVGGVCAFESAFIRVSYRAFGFVSVSFAFRFRACVLSEVEILVVG
jgi:hypothetical protein